MRFMSLFRNMSLTRQIVIVILMMLIILLLSFVISNTIAERIIERKVTDSVSKILLQVEEKTESFYSDMDGISESLLYSPTIQTYMNSNDALSRILMNNEIISVFNNTITLKENIRGIQLYNKEGTMLASIGEGTGKSGQPPVQMTEYSGILTNPKEADTAPYYSIAFPIYNLKSDLLRDYRGTCVFIMDTKNFINILKGAQITKNSHLLLLDQNNNIVANEGNSRIDTPDMEKWKNDKRFILQMVTLPRTGWKLISVIPKNELLQELNIIQKFNIATYLVMICMLGLFLLIFFNRIIKPIKSLMDFMKSYPKTGGERRFKLVYHNEIGVLAANLNKMLDEIAALSQEIQLTQKQKYEIELARKQMEILAFRNQINPHFLYNTLECIRAIAFYHNVHEIADLSTSLSNMFRYSVKGNNFVTIRDELSQVKEYAKIVELRFMGRIKITIEASEELLEVQTLKMVLQPIVENAVFHGLEKKIDNGIVRIRVQRIEQNKIQYLIQDNGYGMEADRLKELLQHMRQSNASGQAEREGKKGIGLSNIYRRIKLFYGDDAEISIQSKWNEGTTVIVTFQAHYPVEALEVG